MNVQQKSQKLFLAQTGPKWEEAELARRKEGGDPEYRIVKLVSGEFTKGAMTEYAEMAQSDDHWVSVPEPAQTQDMAVRAYFTSATSSAATFQLHEARHRCYPYKKYRLLAGTLSQRWLLAVECDEDRRLRRCILDPVTKEFFDGFPSARALLSTSLSCEICGHTSNLDYKLFSPQKTSKTYKKSITRDIYIYIYIYIYACSYENKS